MAPACRAAEAGLVVKFGWQITPMTLLELLNDPDPEKSRRVMEACCR